MGFLLLPTASPYYNPVEYLFGWLKARIKKNQKIQSWLDLMKNIEIYMNLLDYDLLT
jgi:transposase